MAATPYDTPASPRERRKRRGLGQFASPGSLTLAPSSDALGSPAAAPRPGSLTLAPPPDRSARLRLRLAGELFTLRPVSFRYKEDPEGARQYGLIAEEVAKVYPELVTRSLTGEVEGLDYEALIPMLLNELQRQQQAQERQEQELAALKAQQESLWAELARMRAQWAETAAAGAQTAGLAGR